MMGTPVPDVKLTLLGGFAAVVDGEPVQDDAWRLKKARELVKLLALAPGHRLLREQAMDVLWRDRPPEAAANNLHQAVYVARRALDADAIQVRDGVLQLAAEVDVDQLEDAAADARRAGTAGAYRAALALYAGELLPENRYDDWADERRDTLADLAADLEDELGALGGADDDGRSPRLPASTSTFIGRERELGELRALLGGTRLLTLAGTGGVGKTRLALELARDVAPAYSGGAALVELAAVTDARVVGDTVAAALDVRALTGQALVDAVVDFLEPRTLLLVLDNCEHVLGATAGLADALLRSASQLTILATSREPLRVPGEVVFRVPSLAIPDPEQPRTPSELMGFEAVQLFVERARAVAPDFELDDDNGTDVARICFRLDGLPLAVELAAGRLGALDPAAIAGRLGDRFRVLTARSHAAPTRQQTLTATLEWSHDLLEADERTLFRRLAVFSGGFDLEAAESVCADDDLEPAAIADVLARLIEKSLVVADGASSRQRRYRLLETVRLYARERLDEAGEGAAFDERQARWAFDLARAQHRSPRLDRDAANLRRALDTLLASAPADALELCVVLLPFWLRRIDLHEAQRRFDEALTAAPERSKLRGEALLAAASINLRSGTIAQALALGEESHAVAAEVGDRHGEWRTLQFLGELGVATDSVDVARRWLEPALELAHREGFAAGAAIGVYSMGVAYWVLGDLPQAEELVARSIDLLRPLAGSPERIPSPVNIADHRTNRLGNRPTLSMVFEETLQPFVEISCDAAVSYALANQAAVVRAQGDLERARALLEESTARFEAAGDEQGLAMVAARRGYLDLAEGALPEARAAMEKALALRRAQHDRRGQGLVLSGLGFVATTAGDYENADKYLAEAREIFRRGGDRWGLAASLWRTADLAFARGSLDGAQAALEEARSVLGPTQRERWIAHTVVGLAEVAALRGDTEGASALLADARDRYVARDDAIGVADVDERLEELLRRV
jgi:predicted ATPase